MSGENWKDEFRRRIRDIEAGLSRPETTETTKIEINSTPAGTRKVLPVSLKRVQRSQEDISQYVLGAKKILEGTFSQEIVSTSYFWRRCH
ncbi:hypothetical protein AKJ64_00315 [candidate division MSBL1 archaeon SCGC-AAA259E17]|uniref:Uncharacterized protein n=1 Tax=candidate division MSBL1 archaeon SCGC-AAA259E17 TaxID=1698263 RepID=A0A133UH56_9EURY|nr:hypothetical protein AKJ64_00315 [candidate division MSBL1 archaeon SCGC-AAA259E17]